MDKHTFRVLEFDKVLDMAAHFAITAPGRKVLLNTRPLSRIEESRRRIGLVSECLRVIAEGRTFGIERFDDLMPLFQKVRPANALLSPKELRSFLPLFNTAINLRRMIEAPSCPGLGAIVSKLATHTHIRDSIEGAINRDWDIRDNASPALSSIRKGIRSCEGRIRKILEGILKQASLSIYIQDFYLAERNKRWVIPVKRDFKSHIPGVVHDISNTGMTVYVEPYSIQHLGNELDSLRAEEKLEEFRILQGLAHLLREDLNDIEEALAYDALIIEHTLTQQDVAKAVGKSRAYITNTLRLLKLDDILRRYIVDGLLSGGHGRALLGVEDEKLRSQLAEKVVLESLSVRETERLAGKTKLIKNTILSRDVKDTFLIEYESDLQSVFGTKVNIKHGKKKGKIEIEYYNDDDLNRILHMLKKK